MPNNKRIAKNTFLLYTRMMVVMLINLYTVRVVLKALGVVDYGVYNVVAGIITMLSCVTSVLSTSTQRYYSYYMGENKLGLLRQVFSASLRIDVLFSIIVIVIGETIGLWIVNTQLVIPAERMMATNWIYQFSILAFITTLLQTPFYAATIAHEDMGIFAIISTSECVFKLIAAICISYVSFDRLIFYGASQWLIPTISFIAYIIICSKKYPECHYKKRPGKELQKKILSFSGWTLFGSIAGVGMNQVNTLFVNVFFGPIVNAARAIALQINSAISSFSTSFIMSVRPPMIKSYAENNYTYLNKLFYISNKLVYYCLIIVCLPIIFEMDTVLKLWLTVQDGQTILFSRLVVIYAIIMALNNPISIIIQATGQVKKYHISVEIFTLLCMPATYIAFRLGFPAYTTFSLMIIAAILSHIVRLICLKKFYKSFKYTEYISSFLVPAFFITILVSLVLLFIHRYDMGMYTKLAASAIASVVSVSVLAMFFGLSKSEKRQLKSLLVKQCDN